MTLEETNELFSKPFKKDLVLIFDEIDEIRIIINDTTTSLRDVQWNAFTFPEDLSGYYTSVDLNFIRTFHGSTTNIEMLINIDDLAIFYPGMDYTTATLLDQYDEMAVYGAINENRDTLFIFHKSLGIDGYYELYYLSADAYAEQRVITNDSIVKESLTIVDSLCDSDYELKFGRCESKSFTLSVVGEPGERFKDRWFTARIFIENPYVYLVDNNGNRIVDDDGNYIISYKKNNYEELDIGRFKVFSDKLNNDRVTRELVCYDALYDINNKDVKSWIDSLTFPMTLKNFRNSFFNYVGVTQETTTLINDSFSIKGQFGDNASILGQTIIEGICELNGAFGQINSEGAFEYMTLDSALGPYITYPYYIDGTGDYEEYVTDYITGVRTIKEDGTYGGIYRGTNLNAYVIRENPLMYGSEDLNTTGTALGNLLEEIKYISYRPFSVQAYGNPMLPAGTLVEFETSNKTIRSYVMSKTLTGIQNMKDTLEAYGNKRLEKNY